MKPRPFYRLFLLFLVFVFPQTVVIGAPLFDPDAPDAWQAVAPGIEYQKYHFTAAPGRPVDVFVTRMDRSNPDVAIESAIGQGKLSSGVETVRGMAERYEQSINYWGETWGNRNRVVVAINGYFFGLPQEPSGVPWSGVIHSGWYAKRFTETVGDAGFAWALDGDAFIGRCVSHRAEKNDISFVGANYDPNIDAINAARSTDDPEQLILYTPQYDASTKTGAPRVELLIELTRPSLVISDPSYVRGYIREIRRNAGDSWIPFDHVVLSAWDNVGSSIVSRINEGDIEVGGEVRIEQEITNCGTATHDWSKVYASIGGDYHFLNGGVYDPPSNNDATWPNSRTVIAYSASYIFFVVVDAFNPNVSEGITIPELSNFLEDTLGATDAVSLDSGTSSTMVVNMAVVNNTYCTYTRDCGMDAGTGAPDQTPPDEPPPGVILGTDEVDQASVGNGMMMVVVEPRTISRTFVAGQTVTTNKQTSLRLGPGTNYATRVTINSGVQGVVQSHLTGMNGVRAKGSHWWKVLMGGAPGWVKEEDLIGGQHPGGEPDIFFPLFFNSNLPDFLEFIFSQ